jgi:protein kinase C substrate 80K-H
MTKFYCKNEFSNPKFIYSSRVHDGFCDCCDGSDEYDASKGKALKNCPNTCKEEGVQYAQGLLAEIKEVEEGLAIAKGHSAENAAFKPTKLSEKARITAELVEINKNLAEAEVKRSAAETTRNEYKDKLTVELKAKFGVDEAAANAAAANEEKKDADDEWAEDEQDPPAENPTAESGGEASQPAESTEGATPPPPVEETPQQKVDKALGEDAGLQALESEFNSARDKENEIRSQKTTKDNELANVNKILDIDFGPNSRFAALYNANIQGDFGEYTYHFVPFVDARQSHTSLGTFSSWKTPYSVMSFTGGVHCWGGPDRSLDVTLHCGKVNQVIDVREPSKCTYTMAVKTPFACTEETLQSLRARLPKGY